MRAGSLPERAGFPCWRARAAAAPDGIRARRMCLVAAAVASVAGCVSMPDSGPVGDVTASPQASAPQGLIGPFADPPAPGGSPSQIVSGFLVASASYTTSAIAKEYLTAAASRQWDPADSVTVLSEFSTRARAATPPSRPGPAAQAAHADHGPHRLGAGHVQRLTGQYFSAQGQGQPGGTCTFDLVRVDGQWRISNPPAYRMLTRTSSRCTTRRRTCTSSTSSPVTAGPGPGLGARAAGRVGVSSSSSAW